MISTSQWRLPDVIRAPNHLGDLVMALPALHAAPDADVVVNRALAPLLSLADRNGAIIPFDRGRRGFTRAVRALRERAHDLRGATATRRAHGGNAYPQGVLLTPSLSSALMMRLAVSSMRGTATDRRGFLLDESIPRERSRGRARTSMYMELVSGTEPVEPPVPFLQVTAELRQQWWKQAGLERQPLIGVFPGGNAPSRRWMSERFAEVVQLLAEQSAVAVFGGPAESGITSVVAGSRGMDMGGRTSLPVLAAALAECDILISNDSGPLHLAAAVGTPTLSLWGAGDPAETGVRGTAHHLLRHPELPCVPCVRNECPRRGRGYVLPEARLECLQLIAVPDVVSAAQRMVTR